MSEPQQQELHFTAKVPARKFATPLLYIGFERRTTVRCDKNNKTYVRPADDKGVAVYGAHGGFRTYKSVTSAIRNAGMRSHYAPDALAALPAPIVVIFRPDDLEPANIPADERIEWLKAQIIKWRDRLFASGLPDSEMEVICEAMMLDLEILIRRYRERQIL